MRSHTSLMMNKDIRCKVRRPRKYSYKASEFSFERSDTAEVETQLSGNRVAKEIAAYSRIYL